jgi:hypothetical protein
MVPDEQQARDIAVRLAGREGADALLEAARAQVARLVAEPAFLADVERVAVSCCGAESSPVTTSTNS